MNKYMKKTLLMLLILTLMMPINFSLASSVESTVPPEVKRPKIEDTQEIPSYDTFETSESSGGSNTSSSSSARRDDDDDDEAADDPVEASKDLASQVDTIDTDTAKKSVSNIMDQVEGQLKTDAVKAKAEVTQVAETVEQMLKREDVTQADAILLVTDVLKNGIGKVLDQENISSKERNDFSKKAKRLMASTLEKAGRVVVNANETTDQAILRSIAQVKSASKNIDEMTSNEQLKNINNGIEKNVTIAWDDETVSLEKASLKALKANDFGVNLALASGKINLSKDQLKDLEDSEVSVLLEDSSEMIKQSLDQKSGGAFKMMVTKNIEVNKKDEAGNNSQVTGLKISLKVPEGIASEDTLSVVIYNETTDTFEKIKSWINNGEITFKSPHYSYYSLAEYSNQFKDIKGHWAENVIAKMTAKDIVQGKSNEIFDPNGTLTKAEAITMLVNALDLEAHSAPVFKDVKETDWYYEAIQKALATGLLKDMESVASGVMQPNEAITRKDMVLLVANYYALEMGESIKTDNDQFNDLSDVSKTYRQMINGAGALEIIQGYGNSEFRPNGTLKRGEALEILNNLLETIQ